jgi:putative redox protein
MASERSVRGRWTGGLRAEIEAGGFTLVADEPESVGGTGTGPQPTELLLASIASCFTLALVYAAAKRSVRLTELAVDVTGRYDGPRFTSFLITVRAPDVPGLDRLIESAERVCYVTRTLRSSPSIEVVVAR